MTYCKTSEMEHLGTAQIGGRLSLLNRDRADLVFGNLGDGINRVIGQHVAQRLGEMEGHEHQARAWTVDDVRSRHDSAAPG